MKYFFISICLFSTLAAETKTDEDYRVYDETTADSVKNFYLANHTHQTVAFVQAKEKEYTPLRKAHMGIWDAIAFLDTLIDESDPDLSLKQSDHCYQTAEALRKACMPRWFILTGFIHDLGKVLNMFGEPQWAVVGDTFPVGCRWSNKIVFPEYFEFNPDKNIALYQSEYGIYTPHCGLKNVHMSWGHDEYLYQVVKDYLPKEGAFIIRYHSFYALHKENAYLDLLDEDDLSLVPWLKLFSAFDLYSKIEAPVDQEALRPFYEELVSEFFPNGIDW